MNICVLSDDEQVSRFRECGYRPDDFQIFCDNPRFFDQLTQLGFVYHELTEFSIREKWNEINSWACGAATSFVEFSRKYSCFSEVDIPSCMYLFFSFVLTQALKNYYFSNIVLNQPSVEKMVIFKHDSIPEFPDFSGNRYLNYFLYDTSSKNLISSEIVSTSRSKAFTGDAIHIKKSMPVKVLKKVLSTFVQSMMRYKGSGIWAVGSLNHLKKAIEALKEKGHKVVYLNDEFDFQQFVYCLREGFPYVVKPKSTACHEISEHAKHNNEMLREVISDAGRNGLFLYHKFDLTPFVLNEALGNMIPFIQKLLMVVKWAGELKNDIDPKALLTDEDYTTRGGPIASFMTRHGCPVFCMSHANTAVDFCVKDSQKVFGNSITFVQSEYEKRMWAARGWNPQKLVISGVPRYDSLHSYSRKSRVKKNLQLVFCANMYPKRAQTPDSIGYLGLHLTPFRQVCTPAYQMLFEALQGLPIDLIIKPHDKYGVDQWEAAVKESAMRNQVRIISKSESIIKQLFHADVLVLSYWSTTIIEAALLKVPIIYLDPLKMDLTSVQEFSRPGFLQIVQSVKETRELLDRLCKDQNQFYSEYTRTNDAYYLGLQDGKASKRVSLKITEIVSIFNSNRTINDNEDVVNTINSPNDPQRNKYRE